MDEDVPPIDVHDVESSLRISKGAGTKTGSQQFKKESGTITID